ncbi:MAG TPA: alpha/beta fold hydrolase [Isosphaeraceae bacterium]|nr:alpha/beta fold hydrolase [Isosphaeraceae bacterium]
MKIVNNVLQTRTGRKLEVREYGDDAGHTVFFFHGLIGSHYQAAYIADQAREHGLRIIAPNRPGVGASEFVERKSALEAVDDIEDVAAALGLFEFSVIGISGGTPYALATLLRLGSRIRTVTLISGMGPMRLPGALEGMDRRRRLILAVGSRYPQVARRRLRTELVRFRADPDRFLRRLIATWSVSDRQLFKRKEVYDLFMKDLHQVFTEGRGPESLAQELTLYRNYGFSLKDLPAYRRITLWQGLDDNIVPPAMAWQLIQTLPNREAHFVPGGHFVAVDIAGQIITRLMQLLDGPADLPAPAPVGREI